jgi:hypothetical protein
MWARAVLLVVLVIIEPVLAQSPPVVPYPESYKTSLPGLPSRAVREGVWPSTSVG